MYMYFNIWILYSQRKSSSWNIVKHTHVVRPHIAGQWLLDIILRISRTDSYLISIYDFNISDSTVIYFKDAYLSCDQTTSNSLFFKVAVNEERAAYIAGVHVFK